MTTAQLIRRARKRKKLKPAELARRLEVSRSTVHAWENGGPGPKLDHLPGLSKELDLSIDELLASRLAA